MGSCVLKSESVSALVAKSLHEHDDSGYGLDCYVVMPNHVHVILRPLVPRSFPLEKLIQRCKGSSSYEINLHLQQSGTLWQRESFDRIIRDEEHLYRAIQYIGRNPEKAALSGAEARLWMRPAWVAPGWNFEASET
ncbi:MAG: transposase [Pirellulaceae bacterium]|nr:transposase [Pirellulaceae bacterium]